MSDLTTNLKLIKPSSTDPLSPVPFNQNADKLDETIGEIQNKITSSGQNTVHRIGNFTFTRSFRPGDSVSRYLDVQCNTPLFEYDEIITEVNPIHVSIAVKDGFIDEYSSVLLRIIKEGDLYQNSGHLKTALMTFSGRIAKNDTSLNFTNLKKIYIHEYISDFYCSTENRLFQFTLLSNRSYDPDLPPLHNTLPLDANSIRLCIEDAYSANLNIDLVIEISVYGVKYILPTL